MKTEKRSTKRVAPLQPIVNERDVFAREALMGLLASRSELPLPKIMSQAGQLAAMSYILADQMLEMRRHPSSQLKGFMTLNLDQNESFIVKKKA